MNYKKLYKEYKENGGLLSYRKFVKIKIRIDKAEKDFFDFIEKLQKLSEKYLREI